MKTKPLSGELPLWNTRKCHQHQIGKGRNMKSIASIANVWCIGWIKYFVKHIWEGERLGKILNKVPNITIPLFWKNDHRQSLDCSMKVIYSSPFSYPWQALPRQFWENFFSKKVMCRWELCVSYVEKCGQSVKVVHAKEGEAESNINNKCSLSTTRYKNNKMWLTTTGHWPTDQHGKNGVQ